LRPNCKLRRQRIERHADQVIIRQVGQRQRIRAGDQPVEAALAVILIARVLDVDAVAVELVGHPPRAFDEAVPERLFEGDGDAQIMGRDIELVEMLRHRAIERFALPFDRLQPVERQRHHDKSKIRSVSRPSLPTIVSL
jgi:hypothetical protein